MSFIFWVNIVLVVIISTEVNGIADFLVEFSKRKLSEDGKLSFPELSEKYGHPVTEYEVETEDGYLLKVYRQPGDVTRPFLLIHGNTVSGDCWLSRGNNSLSITLANLGYDVWTMNVRGTRYSRKHVTLDPDSENTKFFNYSFYEPAIYDVPAVVDRILEETGEKQLIAIAHSIGTTLLYVMGAEKPEYNEKIKLAVSLAPISYVQNLRSVSSLSPVAYPVVDILDFTNTEEIFDHGTIGTIARFLCLQPLGYDLCIKGILLPLFGYNTDGIERGYEKNLLGHYPDGSTRKIFEHLRQIKQSGRFAKYNYEEERNLIEYGSSDAPDFDLSKVTMNTALLVGNKDYLATVADAELLNASLPNVVYYKVLPYEDFGHADFVWGRRMPELLYPYLFEVINKYI